MRRSIVLPDLSCFFSTPLDLNPKLILDYLRFDAAETPACFFWTSFLVGELRLTYFITIISNKSILIWRKCLNTRPKHLSRGQPRQHLAKTKLQETTLVDSTIATMTLVLQQMQWSTLQVSTVALLIC